MSDCRFGVSPVNYPDPDPDPDCLVKYILPTSILRFINLKEKERKNANAFRLKVLGKLHILMQTAWKSDSYF